MPFALATPYPWTTLSFSVGTTMASIDTFNWDRKDGTTTVDANGVGHGPALYRGDTRHLEVQTLSNVSGLPNDLSNVAFRSEIRSMRGQLFVTATWALVGTDVVRFTYPAAEMANITTTRVKYDCQAIYVDSATGAQVTNSFLKGVGLVVGDVTA